jgi:hypothetical protein
VHGFQAVSWAGIWRDLDGVIFFAALGFETFFFIRIHWGVEEEEVARLGARELWRAVWWRKGGGVGATTATAAARSDKVFTVYLAVPYTNGA